MIARCGRRVIELCNYNLRSTSFRPTKGSSGLPITQSGPQRQGPSREDAIGRLQESVSSTKGTVCMHIPSQQFMALTGKGKQCYQHTLKSSSCWRHITSSETLHVTKSKISPAGGSVCTRKSLHQVNCKLESVGDPRP